MDAQTDELRDAHDVLAPFYAEHLAGLLESMPIERAVLDLFCELTLAAGLGTEVADVGCGTGRLEPYLAGRGVRPRGVDLSPGMVEVARRDNPGFPYEVADLRDLPFADGSLAGVVCWYSLIFLPPSSRETAFAELARVVRPGGYLVTAYKNGDGSLWRGGRTVGVEFDAYWLSAAEMEERFTAAGFAVVFHGHRPPEGEERTPQGYLVVRKGGAPTGTPPSA
ncbi:class I SAM-dependent methyltransferase [Actinoplanes bogorensis]|uniref:Class I SAM-dependent methyltransferase n=1 Tax=Paractinoplanes bogorensis TaxID=1610840 RepID=A0ABS5Z3F0_9ACTN|nr:class I SAM-dependent methyltransferase [Actinoplanes bogorensis]MBU2668955.1 class I SAM-dependent methyltransferase [Actinoplanes bogorensis]